ncbi:MAG: PIN domain-containing protein [Acidobacteriaceae bacterium]|nr:PIN domain-containing protein [Acidobacteriaceae bacterium]
MSDKSFIDTNVLIYAYDVDASAKHEIAKAILQDLWSNSSGVLSTQVLQEFYVNVTKKITSPLPKETARRVVNSYAPWCVQTSPDELAAAFRIEDEARIGFWDALIVASAIKSDAVRILSEDLNPQQIIGRVRIENPFVKIH